MVPGVRTWRRIGRLKEKVARALMAIGGASLLSVYLIACDSIHDDTIQASKSQGEASVSFKPKPSISVKLKEGWQLIADENIVKPESVDITEVKDDQAESNGQGFSSERLSLKSLDEILPAGTIVKHKTPNLLERDAAEILDSERELLRHIIVIFDDPDDAKKIIDLLSSHHGIEKVSAPPNIAPAEKSDQ